MVESVSEPRTGVFLCACGGAVSCVLDLDILSREVIEMEGVVRVERHDFLCSPDTMVRLKESIQENDLDHLVIGACSPHLYMEEFRDLAEDAGINRYMVEMANLREQCAWIHSHAHQEANRKAVDILRMSAAKAARMRPSLYGVVAMVNEEFCDGCGVCKTVCRVDAIEIRAGDGKRSYVNPLLCEGCGVCVSSCPSGAMDMEIFSNDEMLAQINAATDPQFVEGFPNIIVFACHWCSYAAADTVGMKRIQMDPDFRVIRTICSARVDMEWILRAISRGADGVLVLGAEPGNCHYQIGSLRTRNRMALLDRLMEQFGFSQERVQVAWVDASEPSKFERVVSEFIATIRELGPSPIMDSASRRISSSEVLFDR